MICSLCNGDMTKKHVVTTEGQFNGEWLCHERCFEEFMAGLATKRAEFEELLSAGVPRAEANRIMIERMEEAAAN